MGRARGTLGVGRLRVGFAPRYPLGWVHRVPLGWVGAKRYPGGGVRRAQLTCMLLFGSIVYVHMRKAKKESEIYNYSQLLIFVPVAVA